MSDVIGISHMWKLSSIGAQKLPAYVYFCPWCGRQECWHSTNADHVDSPHKGCYCPTLLRKYDNKIGPGTVYMEYPG